MFYLEKKYFHLIYFKIRFEPMRGRFSFAIVQLRIARKQLLELALLPNRLIFDVE